MTLWVFGYGSLLWNPGFEVADQKLATMHGYASSFCMRSIHHRGSDTHPGLVLALDKTEGALCEGVALAVPAGNENDVIAYLRERELISSAYLEKQLPVILPDGSCVNALTYVIDPDHIQYCGGLPLEEQANIIAHAVGGRGPNTEYLYNTWDHLAELGLHDPDLEWLSRRVKTLAT
jgi:cation transport protein ChaC